MGDPLRPHGPFHSHHPPRCHGFHRPHHPHPHHPRHPRPHHPHHPRPHHPHHPRPDHPHHPHHPHHGPPWFRHHRYRGLHHPPGAYVQPPEIHNPEPNPLIPGTDPPETHPLPPDTVPPPLSGNLPPDTVSPPLSGNLPTPSTKIPKEPGTTDDKNSVRRGGFECEFVEHPPESFPQTDCPVCLCVLCEPYQVTCCGYSFCQGCIERVKRDNKPCPTCNEKNFTDFPNKGLKRSLYTFKVYCIKKTDGCMWTGELGQLDNHLNQAH